MRSTISSFSVLTLATWSLAASFGCSSGSSPTRDAAITDADAMAQPQDTADTGGATDVADTASTTDTTDTADAADAGAPMPTVVAQLNSLPASLALGGDSLYVTIAETAAGSDGMVVRVAKTATDATPDGGVTTLASGLNQPRTIAVAGDKVLWADIETPFPKLPDVMTVPTTGGNATELVSGATTMTQFAIANSVLYTLTDNVQVISPVALNAADGGVGQPVYPGNSPSATINPDTDGTSVFFFTNGATNLDLFSVPVAGGTATDISMNATSGSVDFDFLVNDATTIFWSDAGTGTVFSLAKTAGATRMPLSTFATGSGPVQMALDGDNIYLLWAKQLMRLPKAGGTATVLASVAGSVPDTYLASLGNSVALAVDDTFVYWLYEGHGEILKIAK
ncbi:MAG TPA: hypothetical protein VGL59_18985 [Polyangia bacterium]|jgi:hypothetical protein